MDDNTKATSMKSKRVNSTTKIKALKAVKNIPTAILLKKKAECDAKALKIVERLVEQNVKVDWLLQNLGEINRNHMEDVAEERAIIKLCGYVLCNNQLKKIVNKKYQISTLKNKVYDIEKVKNFCSYSCYIAMDHIIMQMLTSPLWLRNEEEIPEFTIMSKCKRRSTSPPGVEVNIMGIELPNDDIPTPEIVPVNEKVINKSEIEVKQDTVNQIHQRNNQEIDQILFCNKDKTNTTLNSEITQIIKEENNQVELNNRNDENISILKSPLPQDLPINPSTLTTILDDNSKSSQLENLPPKLVVDQSELEKEFPLSVKEITTTQIPKNVRVKKNQDKSKSLISYETITARIEQSFTEWITQDTINLLHGEDTDKQQIIDNVTRQDKYMVLCRKLNQIQLQEEKEERSTISTVKLKPAPHFSVLAEEAKDLEIKARAFYNGKLIIDKGEKNENGAEESTNNENIVPLTDAHDPRALRRRIFLEKLNKVMPDLMHALIGPGYGHCSYKADKIMTVKTLISTFDLSSTNIVFRTAEWTLVGLIIIKLLALMDSAIKSLLLTKKATMYMSMILMAYKLDSIYLDHLINSRIAPPLANYCDSDDDSD